METTKSADGTVIAYDRTGDGPPLIVAVGAFCDRRSLVPPESLTSRFTVYTYDRRGRGESGDTAPYTPDREIEDIEALVALAGDPVYLHGTSSGAALAMEAAKHIRSIAKLVVYEPPFIVDDTRTPMPDDWLPRLEGLVADGRPGDAVKMFMRFVGTPAIFTAVMPFTPVWGKLKAAAPTLPYDLTIVHEHQRGKPLTAEEWAAVKVPTLVAAGGKSPAWMANGTRALAGALPDATYRTLPGQNHMVKAQVIAPVLTEFFTTQD